MNPPNDGQNVKRADAHIRWLKGIRRMFQTPALPAAVTVQQALSKVAYSLRAPTVWSEQANAFLGACGVSTESLIGTLSFGQRRAVDLVFNLTSGAYQLLDEPFSGMRASVIPLAAELIRFAASRGACVIAVDHTAENRKSFFDVAHDWVEAEDVIDPQQQMMSRELPEVFNGRLPVYTGQDASWTIRSLCIADRCIAKDLAISLPKGTALLLEGGNGTGKSTLLRSAARVPHPWSGVSSEVRTSTPVDALILSPQPPKLVSGLSVMENLALMIRRFRWYSTSMLEQAFSVLQWLGFDKRYLRKRAEVLSGGEAAMVALVGSGLGPSPIMLLDEPFESLAPFTMPRALLFLRFLLSLGKSTIIISHDPLLAATLDPRSVVQLDPSKSATGVYAGAELPPIDRSTSQ